MCSPRELDALEQGAVSSAEVIVPLLIELLHPRSVVDVGCGTGAWLARFREYGVLDVVGLDSVHTGYRSLLIPRDLFIPMDLREPVMLPRRFDLVLALEVAEHLPERVGQEFVESLTRLGSRVFFSAAIPHQGGDGHLNEQWPEYWSRRFQECGYAAVDVVRPRVWLDRRVDWWYAQNGMLWVVKDEAATIRARIVPMQFPLSVVHPEAYLSKIQELETHAHSRRFRSRTARRILAVLEKGRFV